MALSRDAILALPSDIETEEVPVPEWNDSVLIKGMTGSERDAFEASVRRNGVVVLDNYRAKLLVRVIVNENGTRIFTDKDAAALGKRSSKVLNRLYDAAARLSGLANDDAEEAEGNSGEETEPETADGSDLSSS